MPGVTDPHVISRRTLLAGGAGLVGTGLLASACGSSSTPATHSSGAASAPGSDLGAVEHVVFLMQENRSFDHYFGTYPGVAGFDDRPKSGLGNFAQAWPDGTHGNDTLLPYNLASATAQLCSGNSSIPIHEWEPQHQSWANGTNTAFVKTHALPQNDGPSAAPLVMGYFTRKQLDFYYALASRYTICDRYFCSVIGPTMSNRIMYMSGTLDPTGAHGGPVLETPDISQSKAALGSVEWDTLPEALEDKGVSWKIYQQPGTSVGPNIGVSLSDGFNVMLYFKQYVNKPSSALYQKAFLPSWPNEFESDVKTGTLPSVSWVLPPLAYSEHPNGSPVAGQYFVNRILSALQANKELWAKTVVVLCYDENGGFFDHVTPPTAPPGTPGEYIPDTVDINKVTGSGGVRGPIGLGYRVPAFVISPYSRGGLLAHERFDHTSQLRLIGKRFNVPVPNLTAWRASVTGDMTSAFNFAASPDPSKPDWGNPVLRTLPGLPSCVPNIVLGSLNLGLPYQVPYPQTMPVQETSPSRGTPSG
jgi:phospholipase C